MSLTTQRLAQDHHGAEMNDPGRATRSEASPREAAIRSIVARKVIQGAVGSLLFWAAVNVAGWYFLGGEMRDTLGRLSDPSGSITFLRYSGAIFGGVFFAFAVLGGATRSVLAVWLNGIALLSVGIWNVINLFVTIGALQPHGLTVQHSTANTFWIVLGLAQVVWGFQAMIKASTVGSPDRDLTGDEQFAEDQRVLEAEINASQDPFSGRLSFTVERTNQLPFFTTTTDHYTLLLREDRALCVRNDLENYFAIPRSSLEKASIPPPEDKGATHPLTITTGGEVQHQYKMQLDREAYRALWGWAKD